MPNRPSPVVLRPPVEVMRPSPASEIPPQAEGAEGPIWQLSLKLDGFRCAAFVLGPGQVVLQSRAGRDLAEDFPDIAASLGRLPVGTVLDGELCAYREGRLDFHELLRSRRARERDQVPVFYIAFDLLAVPGRDLRARVLRERWARLSEVLAGVGAPVQQVLATTDRATALGWYRDLVPAGIEGIVARRLDSPYRVGGKAWLKIRHADTVDGLVVAVLGPVQRPQAVVVELPDGSRKVTSPRLGSLQSEQVAQAVSGLLGSPEITPGGGQICDVDPPVPVEVRSGTGRHGTVRFVRVRGK